MSRQDSAVRNSKVSIVIMLAGIAGLGACTPQSSTVPNNVSPQAGGGDLFATHCSSCHGGNGDGVVSSADLSPQSVPDLRRIAADNGGQFPTDRVRDIIDGRQLIEAHHRQMMPRWGHEFQSSEGVSEDARLRVEQKINALVRFVESIQVNK